MTRPAIRVEKLGKQYLLGLRERGYSTLRESIASITTAPLRRFRHLSGKSREVERIWALRDVSFEVQPGEVVGIIGRNGAGKTTLLKILTRITDPTEGRAEVRGHIGSLLEVGTGFHPELTGRENIFLNGAVLGMSREMIKRKFDEIVDFSGVEKFLDTPVKRYSSGMRVRLAFAVAAHLDPEILLIDEVLAVGDAGFQKRCLGKMGDVAQSGRTVLFVSHNMAAVQNLCPRAVLLEIGSLVSDGASDYVIAEYVRSFDGIAIGSGSDLTASNIQHHGTGEAVLQEALLVSRTGERVASVFMGDGFTIRLTVKAFADISYAAVGIAIFNENGVRVCGINSHDVSGWGLSTNAEETAVVECRIPTANLAPGVYRAGLVIQNANRADVVDAVENALSFEVVPTDVYGTGKIPKDSNIIFLLAQWSCSVIPAQTQAVAPVPRGR